MAGTEIGAEDVDDALFRLEGEKAIAIGLGLAELGSGFIEDLDHDIVCHVAVGEADLTLDEITAGKNRSNHLVGVGGRRKEGEKTDRQDDRDDAHDGDS